MKTPSKSAWYGATHTQPSYSYHTYPSTLRLQGIKPIGPFGWEAGTATTWTT